MPKCKGCDYSLPTHDNRIRKFCSQECATKFYNEEHCLHSGYKGLATGTVGAIGGLRVCADLLIKGYEVFRAVSPSCSCDLAVLRSGVLLRIEVKTGYRSAKTGKLWFAKGRIKADHVAVVMRDEIAYLPILP